MQTAIQSVNASAHTREAIERACAKVAPVWPLKHFVAVNPFFNLREKPIAQVASYLEQYAGFSLFMPRSFYRQQYESGRISSEDLADAMAEAGIPANPAQLEMALRQPDRKPVPPAFLVADLLAEVEESDWSGFIVDRISSLCAAYFDMGQASWELPGRGSSLYRAWVEQAAYDQTPALMGLHGLHQQIRSLPQEPQQAIAGTIKMLGLPDDAIEDYLYLALLSIQGWVSWTRYLNWEASLKNESEQSTIELLAIRVVWDGLLYKAKHSPELESHWKKAIQRLQKLRLAEPSAQPSEDFLLQRAFELGYQKRIVSQLADAVANPSRSRIVGRPMAQAAFCIDVRSEVFRRALETVAAPVQTTGFAGFFGVPIEFVPLGALEGTAHLPVLLSPGYRIAQQVKGADDALMQRHIQQRRQRVGRSASWKSFKSSATSLYSFVEATGLAYGPKLLSDSLGLSRPQHDPLRKGLSEAVYQQLQPSIQPAATACCAAHGPSGISQDDRVTLAERILSAMAIPKPYARLVMLAGHGSTTVNNPHATGLDCGACAGQTGEVSARVVCAILNDAQVRQQLQNNGIELPDDTRFIPALHDTTTDQVRLYDTESLDMEWHEDLKRLQEWLDEAGHLARMERSTLLGIKDMPVREVQKNVIRRGSDWSQVRPEWGLANNAAFIAAPRPRTADLDLAGRAFLHEYDWQNDPEFKILELIMTAPMVVANWINMQYYASTVDNPHFGSGNKVLHNIVSGAVGVLEGNGGDLRIGLPLQSLHDGRKWIHEPQRLNVFLEAPREAMDDIIARHEIVHSLIANCWLHLFQIDSANASIFKWISHGVWSRVSD